MERFFEEGLIGDAATVQERLERIVKKVDADEVMVTTVLRDSESRMRSYELIAQMFSD
jgi:alkanesulfonate monooxygenase SsuD/methylene tetrahydromethanopterin reductase-like flavin-dependent oxidoreductase (luciferase family)